MHTPEEANFPLKGGTKGQPAVSGLGYFLFILQDSLQCSLLQAALPDNQHALWQPQAPQYTLGLPPSQLDDQSRIRWNIPHRLTGAE